MEILEVRQDEYENLQAPMFFHFLMIDRQDFVIEVIGNELGPRRRIDLGEVALVVDGLRVSFGEYLDRSKAELTQERTRRFPSADLPAGEYTLENTGRRTFAPGTCSFEGHQIDAVDLKVTIAARILRPVISGSIEVVGRGRVLHLEPIMAGGVEARMSFVVTPAIGNTGSTD